MWVAGAFATLACAQGGEVTSQPTTPAAGAQNQVPETVEGLLALLTENGVHLDLEAHTLSFDTEVGNPTDPIEYVLIHPRGKNHEAILIAPIMPSILNAGLLALGLEAGKNARAVEIEPAPTLEEVRAGAPWLRVFPPEGESIYMTVAWQHDGKSHDVPIEELLMDLTTEQPVVANRWVYLGGNWGPLLRGDPPVFVGDYQGNVISSCYMDPPNHLVTMVHERGSNEQNWWVTELMPPPGTKVRLTIHKHKPAAVEARERRLADAAAKAAEQGSADGAATSRPSDDPADGGKGERKAPVEDPRESDPPKSDPPKDGPPREDLAPEHASAAGDDA